VWTFLKIVSHFGAILTGLFCLLTAVLPYPDDEEKIQSKLEGVWVRVHDYQRLALSRHAAFLTGVAKLESRLLDRFFGHDLTAPQALGMSLCCSFTPYTLLACIMVYKSNQGAAWWNEHMTHEFLLCVAFFLCCVASGVVSLALRKRRLPLIVSLAILFSLVTFLLWVFVNSELGSADSRDIPNWATGALLIAAIGSFGCDVAFISITRRMLRWAGEMKSSMKVLAAVVINLLLAGLFIGLVPVLEMIAQTRAPESYLSHMSDISTLFVVQVPALISIGNFFDVILSLVFLLLALMLLLHRVFWPLLHRTLFRVQYIGPSGRRGLLVSVGLGLLGLSGSKLADVIKGLIK
jgi:hypothetical protein